MNNHSQQLHSALWNIANTLRGTISADQFRDYILGFIFIKFLSENIEKYIDSQVAIDPELSKLGISRYGQLPLIKETNPDLYNSCISSYKSDCLGDDLFAGSTGYFLMPEDLFSNIIQKIQDDEFIIDHLNEVMSHIEQSTKGTDSEDSFDNLFEDIDLNSSKLGKNPNQRNEIISQVLTKLNAIDFAFEDTETDILGDAYEYLIGQFADNAGKKAGEFYTPQQVSTLLSRIVSSNTKKIRSVYDGACGSGSLLLRVAREIPKQDRKDLEYSGQELNRTTHNLARMNMILHGVPLGDFDIQLGDTLKEPMHLLKKPDFRVDAVVANPPFSVKWDPTKISPNDDRFAGLSKLPPSSKADYAFIYHHLYMLSDDGIMAVVLPHGALFRGASEGYLRQLLIDDNYLDAIIGLPAGIFFGTGIPTCIMVLRKCRTDKNVLFIDASQEYEKVKTQNRLNADHINKIVDTYRDRSEIEKYSHRASIEEIKNNDYNLNIPRYVDTFEEEEPVDLDAVSTELQQLNQKIQTTNQKIASYCDELGIPTPF